MNNRDSHPNPNYPLLTAEEETAIGPQLCEEYYSKRQLAINAEEADAYRNGFRPEIWHVADDLLCDGKRIVLIDYPGVLPTDFDWALQRGLIELHGRRELFISGSIRSSKSHYGARKCLEVEYTREGARGWSFHESDKESIARQQPLFWRYLLPELKNEQTGSTKQGPITAIRWSQKNGFTDSSYVLPNKSQHWFRNYEQGVEKLEGESLDVAWLDERAPVPFLKTIRFRLLDKKGLLIVTFTPINDGFTEVYTEYDQNSETVLEVEAPLLPIKKPREQRSEAGGQKPGELEIVGYKKVARIKKAGPGSDGNVKANVLYFHITDNPYFDKQSLYDQLAGAKEEIIEARAYGLASRASLNQFNFVEAVHKIPHQRYLDLVRKLNGRGTRYNLVDPCSGRNWFMLWFYFWAPKKAIIYREWPSFGGPWAYIEGVGDPGPWAVPGVRTIGGKPAADGVPGDAQRPFRFGLDRYKEEIEKAEGDAEKMFQRLIDCRYSNAAKTEREGSTTLIEQMSDIGVDFVAMTGEKKILSGEADGSIELINAALAYDEKTPVGEFSASLGRINEPNLLVTDQCPNTLNALRNWTGKDGGHGACKDPIDCLRGAYLSELDYVDAEHFKPVVHGHFQRR